MAKLSTERRVGGIILILIGFLFFFMGFAVLFFGSTTIIDVISIFFSNVPQLIVLLGLLHITFGILLIWAGRTVRNENFFPDYIKDLMK